MSWLLVTHDLAPAYTGGVASWTEDLARALSAAGEEVAVLARHSPGCAAWDAARPFPVLRARGRSWARWGGTWTALAGALPVLRGGAGLRVVFSTWKLAVHLGPLARRAGARVAIAFHGSDLTRQRAPSPPFARALESAHALLPVSAFLAGELRRLGVTRAARVLPMPLALEHAPSPRGPGLLCVARLGPLKGVDRAARLAGLLGLPLELVGDGPGGADLVKQLDYCELRWHGALDREAIGRVPAAAALLLPRPDADGSGAEGLGLVLIEAALRGLPTIGCRTGGVPEAVGPGLLLEDPDAPTAADLGAARALLADPLAGERARAWARAHHGPAACLEALRAALADAPR